MFLCQDSPHSDVYFATNSSSQDKKKLVRDVQTKLHLLYFTNKPKSKKPAFYVLNILKYIYKGRYSDPSMGQPHVGAIIFHFPL